ncbi:tRNA-splicing endonuclease subunit sen54 [Stygiomarasmius scandens]|uniref:tRNA-splicing endonuclease subunit sen54 n=1 Tax=Marasmiellus scandens TaxID=2682957 RepID=A0ABR1JPS2_9AGAR
MDDLLEKPSAELVKKPLGEDVDAENDAESSGDEEDGGLDWTKLLPPSSRPVIPKRGEKEFEPSIEGGSNLQQHILQRSRNAMFEALRATRSTANKNMSYGIWHPSLSRVSVPIARGQLMQNIGHTVPRPVPSLDGPKTKTQKRLELLPEEAIYLIERGSLFCWKESELDYSAAVQPDIFEMVGGIPMTVQQAYSEMIDKENLTLERYQVYSYLKRLGYVVTRTDPPNEHYPRAAPYPSSSMSSIPPQPGTSATTMKPSLLSRIFERIYRMFHPFDWWKPVRISRWLFKEKNYGHIFRSLRLIPSGFGVPLFTPPCSTTTQAAEESSDPRLKNSPYKPFFNLYKPPTPYKKSAPPPPDYQVVVVDARKTPMPSLYELTSLYASAPLLPPPVPRKRNPPQMQGVSYRKTQAQAQAQENATRPSVPSSPPTTLERLKSWFWPWASQDIEPKQPPPRKLNPFMVLRAGKKTAIIAAVDAGNVNFYRFAMGAFEEGPWFP